MIKFRSILTASLAALAVLAATIVSTPASAQSNPPKRAISKVTGDVYRFQNNFHFAMFVVTNDGIVVTDPINPDAVNWLKGELAKRFNKPVTHMIYSHTHGDHNTGG
jgi:alkyl sulfatase BDS1-like metallo-beta-lactamase superfamily hydrolase